MNGLGAWGDDSSSDDEEPVGEVRKTLSDIEEEAGDDGDDSSASDEEDTHRGVADMFNGTFKGPMKLINYRSGVRKPVLVRTLVVEGFMLDCEHVTPGGGMQETVNSHVREFVKLQTTEAYDSDDSEEAGDRATLVVLSKTDQVPMMGTWCGKCFDEIAGAIDEKPKALSQDSNGRAYAETFWYVKAAEKDSDATGKVSVTASGKSAEFGACRALYEGRSIVYYGRVLMYIERVDKKETGEEG
jgi:hypothetical protein